MPLNDIEPDRVYRRPWLIAAAAVLFAAAAALGIGWRVLAPAAAVEPAPPVGQADVRALRAVVGRQVRDGGELALSSDDANRMLRWALQQHSPDGPWRARLRLEDNLAYLQLSRSLNLPIRRWLNIALALEVSGGQPRLRQARAGDLPLPARWLDRWLRGRWQNLRQLSPQGWSYIEALQIADGQLRVRYAVPSGGETTSIQQPAALWFGAEVEQRLHHYRRWLNDRQRWPDRHPALSEVLHTAIREAGRNQADPVTEHMALLLALAQQESAPATATLLQRGRTPSDRWLQPQLHGRRDLAQHFVLAAALSLYAGDAAASQIGILKELEDLRRNGLDTADLLANHAGIRFAAAITAPERAAVRQRQLAEGIDDGDIMPSPRRLPASLVGDLERLAETQDEQAVQDYLEDVLAPLIDALPLLRTEAQAGGRNGR